MRTRATMGPIAKIYCSLPVGVCVKQGIGAAGLETQRIYSSTLDRLDRLGTHDTLHTLDRRRLRRRHRLDTLAGGRMLITLHAQAWQANLHTLDKSRLRIRHMLDTLVGGYRLRTLSTLGIMLKLHTLRGVHSR